MIRKKNPGNIYSGDRELAILTNPTELAKKKGNLIHSYPIKYNGIDYLDAETAYQTLAKYKKTDAKFCYNLCEKLVEQKLKTYPKIVKLITDSGGVNWLKQCSHWVGFKKQTPNRWEGHGEESGFIRCLIHAYEKVML